MRRRPAALQSLGGTTSVSSVRRSGQSPTLHSASHGERRASAASGWNLCWRFRRLRATLKYRQFEGNHACTKRPSYRVAAVLPHAAGSRHRRRGHDRLRIRSLCNQSARHTLVLSSGSLEFNTSDLTVSGSVGGLARTNGVVGISQSSNVHIAVFCFRKINLGSNVNVTVTGNRGLALLSRSTISIATTVSVHGTAGGFDANIGYGGVGAEGGVRGLSFSNAPPPSTRGNGGVARAWARSDNGVGYGAGEGASAGSNGGHKHGGGGASHAGSGGAGGTSCAEWTIHRGDPGPTYGGVALSDLIGGSGGGGGGSNSTNGQGAGGGGGGGAQAGGGGGGGGRVRLRPALPARSMTAQPSHSPPPVQS